MGKSAKSTKVSTASTAKSTAKSTASTGRASSPGAINKSKPTNKSKSSSSTQYAGANKKSTSTDWSKSLSGISSTNKTSSGNKAGNKPKSSVSSALSSLPSLSLTDTDKFNVWANEYGSSNLVMSPNQKNVKDGYVRVIQPNGSTSLVSKKSLESAVSRVAKQNAWQTKEQMGLDKFTEDKTPTAYTDIYGYSHVADASTAAQYQNYAERMKQALGNTYTFSGKGNTQETSGIGTSNLYDYTGNQSGGYARNENGARVNLPIQGAVNFGNKTDSQGRVIQEPWADASTIGVSKNYQDVIGQLRTKTQTQTQPQAQQTGTQALTGEALIAKIKQGDSTLGESEIQRAQKVYQEAQASGDTERANLAHKWANRIREAMGVSSQYDPVTGAISANDGDTNIPESTYTPDYGTSADTGLDYSDIDTSDYQYGDLSSGLDYSGEDAYSGYDTTGDTTGTDTYSYQDYTGTTSAAATTTDATTAYSTPEVTDLSATITEMFGNNLQSAIDAIRTKVDEMKSQYEAQLATVPQQYQESRNQASAESVMNQRIANEQLANLGLARSGQMLTTQAQTGAAMQNRMSAIDTAQQAAESEIQQAIYKLQSEGRADEAELIAANQKELTEALLDEYSRQQEAGQQQFENQLALSKFQYEQQSDAQDLAMEEAKFQYQQQSDAQDLAYKVQQAKADQQYKYDALKQQYGIAKANLILQQQKAQQSAYQFEVSQRLKELSQQQDFSIKEANLALSQAKLAAENDPTTLKNQKLLLDIEKTKQAIAQANITDPLQVEKLKKQIANIGVKSGSSSGSSSSGSNNSIVQHALNVIQANQEKGIQHIVNTGKQYNFGSYITKMKQDGTWAKLSEKEKGAIYTAVNKVTGYANTEANKRKGKTSTTNAYYQAGS